MNNKCRECEFFRPLGPDYASGEFYAHAGECKNPKVVDEYDPAEGVLIRAGGSDGDGDYFHVHENFGCIKFKKAAVISNKNEVFTCCSELAAEVMVVVDDNNLIWVYDCKVCKKRWEKDPYDMFGVKVEIYKAHSMKTEVA